MTRFVGTILGIGAALAIVAVCQTNKSESSEPDSSYVTERREMIRSQLKQRGINDRALIAAFERVPRHKFVDPGSEEYAYGDYPLKIDEDQSISQPFIVALMTQLLKLEPTDRVLEIGTGSGYQAAILSELVTQVYSIEIIESLALKAAARLDSLGYDNVTVVAGDGFLGLENEAPFDAIIVTCAAPRVPPPLINQLAEGGRMVLPLGTNNQELVLVEKKDDRTILTEITSVWFVPMTGDSVEISGSR